MINQLQTITDEQLVYLYQHQVTGNSFELLYNRYVQKVYRKCLKMTNDSEEARDLTQDIFIKVLDKIMTFQHRSTFSSWLYAISHNYCLNQLKASKRITTDLLTDTTVGPEPGDEPADSRLDQISLILCRVPEDQVLLLRLKYEQGLSVKEISHRFQLTESAVKMRLKRARQKVVHLYHLTHPEVVE